MKTFAVAVCLSFFAAGGFAQGMYSMAVQQARHAGESPAQNRHASPAPAPAANPALQATLKNISDLQADFTALGTVADADAASDQKISLLNHLSAAPQGTKASLDSVKTLAKDLATALAGKKIAGTQQTKLARSVHALFNSAHLSAAQQKTMLDDVQKILTGAGVSTDAVTDVATDLKKIAAETKSK